MRKAKIYYARMDEFWRKEEKLSYLEKFESLQDVDWQEIQPDKKYIWLTNGMENEFSEFISIGNKDSRSRKDNSVDSIFQAFSNGLHSSRDAWVYNFNSDELSSNIQKTIDAYNEQVSRWNQKGTKLTNVDDFVTYDDSKISWSSTLKIHLKRGTLNNYDSSQIRYALYRPFCKQFLYFDEILNDRRGQFPAILPQSLLGENNIGICLVGIGNRQAFGSCVSKFVISMDFAFEKAQFLPFYIYDEDGTNRKENITDWALEQFQTHYQDPKITKWDIFHYTYALLHHPHYRQRYAANLKRELPRIPFAPEFHPFAISGKRLTEIHINYEQQPEYRLKHIENKDLPIDWRVEKMRLSKDKTQIKYNDFLTLTGIPPETFEYKLGNRSALDWIIDQYQVSTDKRSGITNDPNRLDDEEYIVRLIKQVITVSLETVKIVKGLPDLGLPKD
ncbi:MAG: type ISP restriction/modification enzyme [Pseudanabaenaceae cyanobacterium bins.39]|nr:type ISP restriction/modification enzyme [Pseudanabaenaceae cyanobacterium bins.39]